MQISIFEDEDDELSELTQAQLRDQCIFYYGADFVLEALADNPEEIDLIREEIRQHLKRVEEEFANPNFSIRPKRED